MKRSDFLKLIPAGTFSLLLNGLPVRSVAGGVLDKLLARYTNFNDRIMVFIQLNGGNDGLNCVIPLDQYSNLSTVRSNIMIPENKVLDIGIPGTGLHPAMAATRDMFNDGLVNIVQGVAYPNPSFSHFRAADILLTASDSSETISNGWLGRYLAEENTGYPAGYPNNTHPDPLAIEIGTSMSLALNGPNVCMGTAISDINSFYDLVGNTVSPAPDTPAGHELTFIRFIAQESQLYSAVIRKAAGKANNLSLKYPANNFLADQLKIVARLIGGGLQTQVYIVNLHGFDSHTNQVESADPATGGHAYLLGLLSEAVSAFFDDCKLLKVQHRVAAMTFSEFGRRIASNGGLGTDHGTACPMFVFGENVNPGIIGSNPVIPAHPTYKDNLDMQFDYRTVYSAVLEDYFGVPPATATDVLLKNFDPLPIFKKYEAEQRTTTDFLFQNYPNPFSATTTIRFRSPGSQVTITLINQQGVTLKTIATGYYADGLYEIRFTADGLPPATYYAVLTTGDHKKVIKMVLEK